MYRENKSYIRFQGIISNIVEEAAELRTKVEASAQFLVDAMDRVNSELKPAQRDQDRAQGLLVSEEMYGQVNPKTALAAEAAAIRVTKLEQSSRALARTGSLAIAHLEKQVTTLSIKLTRLKNERYLIEFADNWYIPAIAKKAKIKAIEAEIAEVADDLQKLNENLKVLKNAQGKNGNLIFVDANTRAAAEATMQTAVDGYREIEKLREDIVKDVTAKREQFQKLKEELRVLEEVRGSLNPEVIADQLYGSEIEAVFLTEEYEAMNTKLESQRIRDRNFLRVQLGKYLKQRARAS